ncbi:DUF748 domain-containing protein [Alteromonas oceanisediminis]|uniref:DUF748 domain-containing protein n=1 Tax=Alteromonas oceanisediminis TaxID=2836180 RepID=UPI001BD9EC3B|nr:DUF748 domain-containing protein [Alteromonas oceanisediminis]MBT0586677.1 DUF748 domain-containing protein [Alteromonas oceanisediminis]
MSSKGVLSLVVLAIVLLSARIAAPHAAKWYANKAIADQPGIEGYVDDVSLALIRGSYTVSGISIRQAGAESPLPLFAAKDLTIGISWQKLLAGELVTQITLHQPTITALDRRGETDITQEAVLDEKTWIGLANDLSPFSVEKLTVIDGKIAFSAISANLFGGIMLNELNGEVTNLHNDAESDLLTELAFTGAVEGTSKVDIKGALNPNTQLPTFDVDVEIARVPTSMTENIIKIYAPFDIEAGEFDFAAELKSNSGKVEGYFKAGVYDLTVFSWKEDVVKDGDNPLQLFVEGISALLATLFENNNKDLVATRIPISGDLSDPSMSFTQAISGLFYNAFVQAYQLKVEDVITFEPTQQSEDNDES